MIFGKKQENQQPAQPPDQNGAAVVNSAPAQTPNAATSTVQQGTAKPTAKPGSKNTKGKSPAQQNPYQKLGPGSVSLVDLIAPSAVEVDFKHVRVGDKYFRTFFVVDYPREVSPNWLSILIDHKETMNVSMFIYPVESKDILTNLRRKIAEMEATLESDAKQGMESDPKVQAALEDAIALREELARGLERFFQFGLYVTLAADTVEELNEKSSQLTTLLASNLLIVKPATLQMEDGFKTTLPYGSDKIFITRNMDTTSVASTFPFTSYEISQPNGILYGVNTLNNSLVIVDRFSFENANSVVFGKSGAGKSFTVKLEILRQMMFDAEILIIDPEDEYKTLCHALDGEYINFSKNSEVKINPFALLTEDMSEAQLGIKILSLHGLLKTMIGEVSPTQEALMDRSLVLVYKQKGITPDPATYKNEPPILEDLYKTLLNMEENEAKDLAFRLEKYVKGGFSGLFNHQTNYDVKNQLTVFSIKQLEDAMRPVAMHTILDFIWSRVRTKLKKRLLIVDEAWYLMKYPDSASFLQGIAKRARKYYLGVTTLTQDIEDFLNNDYGKAIVSNSSIQILLKQNTSEVEALAKAFALSEGEKQYLLTAQVGEGLLFAGQNHISAQFLASQFEYDLISSKPEDVMEQEAANQPQTPPPAPNVAPQESDSITSTINPDTPAPNIQQTQTSAASSTQSVKTTPDATVISSPSTAPTASQPPTAPSSQSPDSATFQAPIQPSQPPAQTPIQPSQQSVNPPASANPTVNTQVVNSQPPITSEQTPQPSAELPPAQPPLTPQTQNNTAANNGTGVQQPGFQQNPAPATPQAQNQSYQPPPVNTNQTANNPVGTPGQ